jgi:hypothetical protein
MESTMSSIADRTNFRTALASSIRQGTRDAIYFWIIVAVLGLATVACGIAGSYFPTDMSAVSFVGP